MERFIEVKAKSQPVYSKGYWMVDLFFRFSKEEGINDILKLIGRSDLLVEREARGRAEG